MSSRCYLTKLGSSSKSLGRHKDKGESSMLLRAYLDYLPDLTQVMSVPSLFGR